MEKPTLHELVKAYHSGSASKEAVMERVATLVYREPGRFGFDDEDDAANALERHGRRIAALADRFVDRGIGFEAYLETCLRFLARTMRRERRRAAEKELVCERARSGQAPSSSDYQVDGRFLWEGERRAAPSPRLHSRPGRRLPDSEVAAFANRLVFLTLKCAWEVDDELAGRVAESSGVDPDWLGSALAQARRSLEAERCRHERMQARRNNSWCRLRLLEARASGETDPARRAELAAAIRRERCRFDRARAEIVTFRPVVPNSVVARILGVPKGTVDSGLYYLRKRSRRSGAIGEPW